MTTVFLALGTDSFSNEELLMSFEYVMFLQETQSPLDGFVCSRARFTAGERHELLGITLICEAWCKLLMILILSSFLSGLRGRKAGGVGVMKDKELKLKETEASHTLGGIHQSRRSGLVVFRGPMNLCSCVSKERGDGEGVVWVFWLERIERECRDMP